MLSAIRIGLHLILCRLKVFESGVKGQSCLRLVLMTTWFVKVRITFQKHGSVSGVSKAGKSLVSKVLDMLC